MFETLLRQLRCGVLVTDAGGQLLLHNLQGNNIWAPVPGPPGFPDYPAWKGFHPDGRPYTPEEWPVSRSIRTGEVVDDEEILIERNDGTRATVCFSSTPVRDERGQITAVVASFYDVSRRIEAEEALRRSERNLKELNERLEERVAERTEEVRRLAEHLRALAAALTLSEQRERQRMSTVLHDHIQQLLVAAQMHLGAVRRLALSDVSRAMLVETDKNLRASLAAARSLTAELSPPVLRDVGLAAAIEWLARPMREQHGLEMELSLDPHAEPDSEDIRLFLFDCVRRLLHNVVQHARVHRVRVGMAREANKWTRLTVDDEGSGFDPGVLQRTEGQPGKFGLFGIQQRLAYIGGWMEVRSQPGQGTHIALCTPLKEAEVAEDVAAAVASTPSPGAPKEPVQRIRVLVADDHKVLRELLVRMLRTKRDIEIVGEAGDGRQAVELARRLQPDVVLMDITMPELDGIEATRALARELPQVRVIGLSMHEDPNLEEAMLHAGAVDYLTKGAPVEKVVATIRAHVPVAKGPAPE